VEGLGPVLFGGSLGGPISQVTSQKARNQTHAFTKICVFGMKEFGGRPCIGERPGAPWAHLESPTSSVRRNTSGTIEVGGQF